MSQQNVETVKSLYASFNKGDIHTVLKSLDPKIEWTLPSSLPFGGKFRGIDGASKFFQSLPPYFPVLRVDAESFVASGDDVVAHGHHRGRAKGGAFEIPWSMHWTFRNGKAVKMTEYQDTASTLKAIGT